jgi:uncharacterized protein (TIGR00369 family)
VAVSSDESVLELVRRVTARSGYTSAVGTTVSFAEPGEVHMELKRRPDLLQCSGFFHGGVISGLADHAAGGAVATALPAGKTGVTIDLHVNFLAPADGESITAKAKAMQIGGTVCTASVDVFTRNGAEERLCSFAVVTLRVVDMPSSAR